MSADASFAQASQFYLNHTTLSHQHKREGKQMHIKMQGMHLWAPRKINKALDSGMISFMIG